MNRNFYIALVASVIAHGLLLVLSISLSGEAATGVASEPPPLNYRLEVLASSSEAGEPAVDTKPVAAVPVAQTPEPPPQVTDTSTPTTTPERRSVAETTKPEQRSPAEQQSSIVPEEQMANTAFEPVSEAPAAYAPDTIEPPATDLNIVTAVVPNDQPLRAVPEQSNNPVPVKQPLSKKQQKMLDKKLRKWAKSFHHDDMQNASVEWKHKGQEYTAKFHSQAAVTDTSIDQVLVEISTEENGQTVSTMLKMKRLAFSNFAQFVNHWDPSVQLHNDELEGRFHANSAITIEKSRGIKPTFHGKVTTAARNIDVNLSGPSAISDDMFRGGLETGVGRIGLPKRFVPFAANQPVDEQQVHRVSGDTRIVFHANGTYDWGPVDNPMQVTTSVISDTATTYIIGARKSRLFVSGTVKGKVLVSTPDDIVIEQDLLYAHDPASTTDGNDYLGLVSDRNVEIAPPDVTGPGDLRVYASIFAKRRFAVKQYRAEENSTLYIYGSIAAGSLTATEPRYSTKMEYDPRLEELRAPGFPLTDRYEMVSWDREWSFLTEEDPIEIE